MGAGVVVEAVGVVEVRAVRGEEEAGMVGTEVLVEALGVVEEAVVRVIRVVSTAAPVAAAKIVSLVGMVKAEEADLVKVAEVERAVVGTSFSSSTTGSERQKSRQQGERHSHGRRQRGARTQPPRGGAQKQQDSTGAEQPSRFEHRSSDFDRYCRSQSLCSGRHDPRVTPTTR